MSANSFPVTAIRKNHPNSGRDWLPRLCSKVDILIFLGLLTLLNLHLLGVNSMPLQVFTPRSVSNGQWWRILTHPFVHVSWYHLMLDAGAFLLLYGGLKDHRVGCRLGYAVLCAGSSLIFALIFAPQIDAIGLCGLSGTAHGLMVFCGLDMMRKKRGVSAGLLSFWLVVSKSVYEMFSGDVMFEFLHLGLCGKALAPCHLGGVVGGLLAFLIASRLDTRAWSVQSH